MKRTYYDNGDTMAVDYGYCPPRADLKKRGVRILAALAFWSFIFAIFAAAIVSHVFFFTD